MKQQFYNVIGKIVIGTLSACIISFFTYLYEHKDVEISWIIKEPINFFEKFYYQIPLALRVNLFFWGMVFFIYYILERYDKQNDSLIKRTIVEENYFSISFMFYSFFLTIGILFEYDLFSSHGVYFRLFIRAISIVLTCAGFYILIAGRVNINGLWGPDLYSYEGGFEKKVITTGIYSKMRHPIYLGQILLSIASFLASNSIFLFVFPVILILVNIYRAGKEERHLNNLYPNEYAEYKKAVKKWWLL